MLLKPLRFINNLYNVGEMINPEIPVARLPLFFSQKILSPGNLYLPIRAVDKFLQKINACFYLKTHRGLKFIGKGMTSQELQPFIQQKDPYSEKYGDPKNWRINPDFLTDPYSLTGLPITQSPHYKLIGALATQQDLKTTDYAFRMQRGLLDLRKGGPLPTDFMSARFRTQLQLFQEGQKFLVKGFVIAQNSAQNLIIADGKHTVAMAAYFGFETNLEIALLSPAVYQTPFFTGLIEQLHKQANSYAKNIQILKVIHDFNPNPHPKY